MIKKISIIFLTSCLIGVNLSEEITAQNSNTIMNPTNVNENNGTNKPRILEQRERSRQRRYRNRGSSSRSWGCQGDPTTSLNLLVPSEIELPKSIHSQPLFWFNLSKIPSVPVVFSIVNTNSHELIILKEIKSVNPGLNKIELPPDIKLNSGEQYRWSVSLICDRARPDKDIYREGHLKIAANISSELKMELSNSTNCSLFNFYDLAYDAMLCNLLEKN
ncbi:MAG: DUF928 domain-containing protein [Prochloraceae cyanobacterium]|nr:DUF928 domain-containing protein [Prochloraceae cyanobacterium]